MPSNATEYLVYSAIGINAKTTGATLIATTENGTRSFYPTAVIIESTAATSITLPLLASVGTNATSYNNIMGTTTATGLTSTGNHFPTNLAAVTSVVPSNTGIYFNITTAATGTSQTVNVHVIGFYR